MANMRFRKFLLLKNSRERGPVEATLLTPSISILKKHPLYFVNELGGTLVVIINREVVEISRGHAFHSRDQVLLMAILTNIRFDVG